MFLFRICGIKYFIYYRQILFMFREKIFTMLIIITYKTMNVIKCTK